MAKVKFNITDQKTGEVHKVLLKVKKSKNKCSPKEVVKELADLINTLPSVSKR